MDDRPGHSFFEPAGPIEVLATQDEEDRPCVAPHSVASSAHDTHAAARAGTHAAASSEHSLHSAPTLAIVPRSSSSIPSFARSFDAPPRRATPFSQPTVADLFAAVHRLEDCVHTLTVNQRNMALQLGNLRASFAELQRRTSNLEQRLVRQREMQDELDTNAHSAHTRVAELQSMLRNQGAALEALQQHSAAQSTNIEQRIARLRTAQDELDNTAHNAHERISDVQSNLRQQSAALDGLQDTLSQATSDVRQLRRRIGHALQVMGSHISED